MQRFRMMSGSAWLTVICAGGMLMSEAVSAEKEELERLVASLVSRNDEPPKAVAYKRYEFPREFDQQENRRVVSARDALLEKGVAAFPYLIDALDDARYSWTDTVHEDWAHHWRVREVCLRIIEVQVDVYGEFVRGFNSRHEIPRWLPVPPPSPYFWPECAKKSMTRWWAPRASMTLRELQSEAVEWAVQYEQVRGFCDNEEMTLVLGWYKPLEARLQGRREALRVAWKGEFVGEEELKPKRSEKMRQYELRKRHESNRPDR